MTLTARETALEECYAYNEHIDISLQFWRGEQDKNHAKIMRLHAEGLEEQKKADLLCGIACEIDAIKEAQQ